MSERTRPKSFAAILLAALFHVVLAGIVYRAIVKSPSSLVIAGQQVGGYFTWLFWWWSYSLRNGLPLFHSNFLMYPVGVPLFPHSLLNDVPAVLLQTVFSPYFTTNFLLISTHILTGVTMFLLAREITKNNWASLSASVVYSYSSYMITQHIIGQVIEATLYFNPLLALAVIRHYKRPNSRSAWFVAGALLGVFLSGPYVGFCFGLIFSLAALIFDVGAGEKKTLDPNVSRPLLKTCSISVLIALVAYSPLLRLPHNLGGGSEFYASYALTFLDPPFWHTSSFIQSLRMLKNFSAPMENMMGYVGWGSLCLIAIGASQGAYRNQTGRFFIWLFLFSGLLSLGSKLAVSPAIAFNIPLPYAVFRHLPLLSSFRNAGRILMTTSLATGILVALSIATLSQKKGRYAGVAITAIFLAVTWFEFDLWNAGQRIASSVPSGAYRMIKDDQENFAILELPQYYNPGDTLFIPSQYYMLLQPYHEKPMVLGCPTRYFMDSLSFTENTPVLYELTHPEALKKLLSLPEFSQRKKELTRDGKKIFSSRRIKYVVYHTQTNVYDPGIHILSRKWLEQLFGPPYVSDGDSVLLFKVY